MWRSPLGGDGGLEPTPNWAPSLQPVPISIHLYESMLDLLDIQLKASNILGSLVTLKPSNLVVNPQSCKKEEEIVRSH